MQQNCSNVTPLDNSSERGSLYGLVEVAKEIARKRQELVEKMRTAFLDGDEDKAITYAKTICGVTIENEKSY